jgi:hypothetical protein
VDGDNSEANFDYNNQGVCGARSDRRAVWYEINGVGKEVTVYLCTNNGKLMDFGVFRACNTQNCLGFPPQQREIASCDNDESNEYVFMAEEGESYYIHVRSDVLFEGSGSIVSLFRWYSIDRYTCRRESTVIGFVETKDFHLTSNILLSFIFSTQYGTRNQPTHLQKHQKEVRLLNLGLIQPILEMEVARLGVMVALGESTALPSPL